ncbi:sporulation integral membrane protein YlbJ [Priestia koreensis]|uniref:sporulation integral membrane protein YlbJ n=1 Tax=Priestia koreensis TaxID=284581 RepID=UPI001F5794B4|nr:sporulation integral membrane protein YlbJ [Priestia koreensis]
MTKSVFKTLLLSASALLLAGALIIFPQEAVKASVRGLDMWWKVVFPSLLPFFIASEMLIGFGVVKFVGILLEPFMRPIFRVPGAGGFVLAMGMASGFPAGAKLTARLRQERQLTSLEATRLVSFTNSSNPLFICGAVAVGFFHNPHLGILLALAHYLGNLSVGVIMRFYGGSSVIDSPSKKGLPSFKEALREMHRYRLSDNRPIGKLLGDAVSSAIQSLLMIGGFIILFSVLNKLLLLMNVTSLFSHLLSLVFPLFHLSTDLSLPFVSGLFEITLGSRLTSDITSSHLLHQAIITSFILGFSGFSVQAQVASILAETDIKFLPFFIARILHGCFAMIITILLWRPLHSYITSYNPSVPTSTNETFGWMSEYWHVCITYGPLLTIGFLLLYVWLLFKNLRRAL